MSPHLHDWELVGFAHVTQYSEGIERPVAHKTELHLRCRKCPKLKTKRVDGLWTREELAP